MNKILETAMGMDISDVLIAHLEQMFPNSVPMGKNVTPLELGRKQGEQLVVSFLKSKKKDLENSIYNTEDQ